MGWQPQNVFNGAPLQSGVPLNVDGTNVGRIFRASETYVFKGSPTGNFTGIISEATVRGTSPAGPSARFQGIMGIAEDAPTVVNRNIQNATNNGSGLIRISAASHTFSTGDSVGVYGVTGTTEANGQWLVTVIDANTFDLQGSAFSHAYVSGGVVTNRGAFYAGIFVVNPILDRAGLTGTAANGDDVDGVVIFNSGSGKATDAIFIAGSAWATGLTIAANCDTPINLLANAGGYGINFIGGTYGNGVMLLPNNVFVNGRNNTGTVDVQLFLVNTLNELQFFPPLRFSSSVAIQDGVNLGFGTTTGSKIGTGAAQKIGFWNASPVAQPSGTPAAAVDLPSVITLANFLRTSLLAEGLVA